MYMNEASPATTQYYNNTVNGYTPNLQELTVGKFIIEYYFLNLQ